MAFGQRHLGGEAGPAERVTIKCGVVDHDAPCEELAQHWRALPERRRRGHLVFVDAVNGDVAKVELRLRVDERAPLVDQPTVFVDRQPDLADGTGV